MVRIWNWLRAFWENTLSNYISLPKGHFSVINIIEILIIAFLIYRVLVWIKNTRAWNLFKGLMVILVFVLIASLCQMTTIVWIAKNTFNIGLIALVVIFQPELRKALENLGDRRFFGRLFDVKRAENQLSEKTIDELVRASYAMGRVKTGALIVLENEISLAEYVRTGIDVDAVLTSQLLINIFEKNTPLHDGAVIVRGNRVVSATCYLPLSDSATISKDLGTRHRAAVGISEVSDSVTIIVSEETGKVSLASHGKIYHDIDEAFLREKLKNLQNGSQESGGFVLFKRRLRNGKKNSESTHE